MTDLQVPGSLRGQLLSGNNDKCSNCWLCGFLEVAGKHETSSITINVSLMVLS